MARKRRPSDGPSPFADTSKHWVPIPYEGILPNGRKTHIPRNQTIPIRVGAETYHAPSLPLAQLLAKLGVQGEDPEDWIRNEAVADWVKLNGIRELHGR